MIHSIMRNMNSILCRYFLVYLLSQGQYKNLMALARERQKKLSETVQAYVLVREAAELSQWIKDKEQHAQIEDVGEDLEQVCDGADVHRHIG